MAYFSRQIQCADGKNDVNSDVRDGVKSLTPRLLRDTSSSDGRSSMTKVDGGNDPGRADNTGPMISNTTILQVNSRLVLDSPDSSLVEGISTPLREMVFGGMEGNSYSPQDYCDDSLGIHSNITPPTYNIGDRVLARVPGIRFKFAGSIFETVTLEPPYSYKIKFDQEPERYAQIEIAEEDIELDLNPG